MRKMSICLTVLSILLLTCSAALAERYGNFWNIAEFKDEWNNPIPDPNGAYLFPLQNRFRPDKIKLLRFYMEFDPQTPVDLINKTVIPFGPDNAKVTYGKPTIGISPNGLLTMEEFDTIFPQPSREVVKISMPSVTMPESVKYANLSSICLYGPEPTSMLLLGSGLISLIGFAKGKKRE